MRGLLLDDMAASAASYLAWWDLAGVDCAIGEAPVDWLRPAPIIRQVQDLPASNAPVKPATIDAFRAWLMDDPGQPERRWPGTPILPQGPVQARLMVITDMPDPADMAGGTLLTDRAGRLFDAMLAAVGLNRADIYIASLFLARPPGGMVEATDLAMAADRMRTHVALAAPRQLLLLGDRTIRTFLPVQDNGGGNDLHFFNHDGGTVPALATFHPRLLLGQPAAKAECWRTLQRLVEEQNK
ncbi:MAG TPA: uracil-DNA glycosylase family protein [Sphingobium sp.]|nr:uracil-DNA glycosylase family protein [Sphingobium sp.]